MKALILSVLFLGLSAVAGTKTYNLNDFYLVGGSFGFDPNIDQTVPYAHSADQARAVYSALDNAALTGIGSKKGAGVSDGSEIFGLKCTASNCGIYSLVHKSDLMQGSGDNIYTVRFPEVISFSMYVLLTGAKVAYLNNAPIRSVANVSCMPVAKQNYASYSCSIQGVYTQIPPVPVQFLVDQNPDPASKAQFTQLMYQTLQSIGY